MRKAGLSRGSGRALFFWLGERRFCVAEAEEMFIFMMRGRELVIVIQGFARRRQFGWLRAYDSRWVQAYRQAKRGEDLERKLLS